MCAKCNDKGFIIVNEKKGNASISLSIFPRHRIDELKTNEPERIRGERYVIDLIYEVCYACVCDKGEKYLHLTKRIDTLSDWHYFTNAG